jgi:Bacterial HORMA domain family 1
MNTGTQTKTVADVRRVLNSFGADFSMKAQSTGLRTREDVEGTVADLIAYADAGYLVAIVLSLQDASGREIRGSRYVVAENAIGWSNDLPGNNLWPKTPGGVLQLIAEMSQSWERLSAQGQEVAKKRIGIKQSWGSTNADTSFSGLSGTQDRQYSSNGFGLKRWTYQ